MDEKLISNNIMEQMVDFKLVELMELSKMCTCKRCCADVRALALNGLPPKYVVSRVGETMTRYELLTLQMQTNIISAIMHAIEKVSRNPRHNEAK